ncbi:hypothetical protein ACFE3N_16305 [Streptomyces albidoflavus]|uniref:hypothetical protein n=1 Tax=Streptomyces albidoflavus TaxID=1886 RepID=UPI0036D3F601
MPDHTAIEQDTLSPELPVTLDMPGEVTQPISETRPRLIRSGSNNRRTVKAMRDQVQRAQPVGLGDVIRGY